MQQPLERYGVVVLLFLVALVGVVLFWDDGAEEDAVVAAGPDARSEAEAAPVEVAPAPGRDVGVTAGGLPISSRAADLAARDQRVRTRDYGVPPRVGGNGVAGAAALGGSIALPVDSRAGQPGGDPLARLDSLANPGARGTSGQRALDVAAQEAAAREERDRVRRAADAERVAQAERAANERRRLEGTPSATPPSDPGSAASGDAYVVKSGDSLWRIAQRELQDGSRWKEIATLNGLSDADMIKEGMQLVLPSAAKSAPSDAGRPVRRGTGDTRVRLAAVPGTRAYVVQKGDSLGLIAQRELGTIRRAGEIKALNAMKNDVIVLGATLLLPEDAGSARRSVVASVTPEAPRRSASRGEYFVR